MGRLGTHQDADGCGARYVRGRDRTTQRARCTNQCAKHPGEVGGGNSGRRRRARALPAGRCGGAGTKERAGAGQDIRQGVRVGRHARERRAGAGGKFRRDPRRRLIFRLALALGRTVRELLPALTERELTEWAAFALEEPIGGRRGDYQAAVVASTIAAVNRRKGGKNLSLDDFVPEYGKPKREMALSDWLDRRLAEQGQSSDAAERVGGSGTDRGPDSSSSEERIEEERNASGAIAEAGGGADKERGGERLRGDGGDVVDDCDGVGEP